MAIMSGYRTKLPRGTKIEGGKIKLPDPDMKRSKPQQYAARNTKRWRPTKKQG